MWGGGTCGLIDSRKSKTEKKKRGVGKFFFCFPVPGRREWGRKVIIVDGINFLKKKKKR